MMDHRIYHSSVFGLMRRSAQLSPLDWSQMVCGACLLARARERMFMLWARSDELNAGFGTMQRILARAIRDVSREWNRSNDILRVLPAEIRAMCWSYLPQSDLVRLARVCSFWRALSHGTPSLWTSIELYKGLGNLDTLLSRSGTLPVDISVLASNVQEHAYVDDCLRRHAHRLRFLSVIDRTTIRFMGDSRGQELFRYPAPMLEQFSLKLIMHTNDRDLTVAPDIFAGCAPRLLSVTLHEIPFPAVCAAFRCLTTLEVSWHHDFPQSGLQHIFTVSPDIERLVLFNLLDIDWLPPVPASRKLRKVELAADRVSFATLRDHGYLDIPQLDVTTFDCVMIHMAAMHQSDALHVSLSVSATATGAILRGENGATARLEADEGQDTISYAILLHAPGYPALQHLVLPTAAHHFPGGPDGPPQYPYLAYHMLLPVLRTLALAHGAQGEFSIFDPAAVRGVLHAPCLSRVEIVRTGGPRDPSAAAVAPGMLAQFIRDHLECNDPESLELVVAPENADLLDVGDTEGMKSLRHQVGNIVLD